MSEEPLVKIQKTLEKIDQKLAILVSLQKQGDIPPELTDTEKEFVTKFCNGNNTIEDIMEKMNGKRNTIEVKLKRLRKKGIIVSKKIEKKTTYVKV
jgi:DNA-binding CsgD family transcriptional regulator